MYLRSGIFVAASLLGVAPAFKAAPVKAESRPISTPQSQRIAPPAAPQTLSAATPAPVTRDVRPSALSASITLSDIGFVDGFRFANLGGRREVFVPIPQGSDVVPSAIQLVIDDISAYDAKRNLEILVNNRSVIALGLDGKSQARSLRIPLTNVRAKDGFLKLTLLYSGAATPDRCIDVRSVGDSLMIRPETAVEVEISQGTGLDVTATAALMPRTVTVVLPGGTVTADEISTALTVARTLVASGRKVSFHQGYDGLPNLAVSEGSRRWTQGVVLVGPIEKIGSLINRPVATVAGPPMIGALAAVNIAGMPALLVSDGAAGRLLASPLFGAVRGVSSAYVGETTSRPMTSDRITFDQLGVEPAQVDVFGRAELSTTVDMRRLPAGRHPARLLLDLMIAPDGAGEKAVVSAYVNARMLGSSVAQTSGPTRLDLLLPEGLVGARGNVRVVIQRPSAQGDCRFEPQGYPAQILGSSAFELGSDSGSVNDFTDLASRWNDGIELLLPSSFADRPAQKLGLLVALLSTLSPESAPVTVRLQPANVMQVPTAPFLAVGAAPPIDSKPRVRFDRGRVAVADRAGRTLLDIGGFGSGAVVQLISAGGFPGLWVKPLAVDGSLPEPAEFKLDRGDVAFIDRNSVALAMSTERDTLINIAYPDQVSWFAVAERFRSWIVGSLWVLMTIGLLIVLQRMFRRRPATANKE